MCPDPDARPRPRDLATALATALVAALGAFVSIVGGAPPAAPLVATAAKAPAAPR
jgi:hypothetical protein